MALANCGCLAVAWRTTWQIAVGSQHVPKALLYGAKSVLHCAPVPPSTTSRATIRPAGLLVSAHRARVANTHRQRVSALAPVPCAAATAPRPVHLHRTLRRARKRLLARPGSAARAWALPTGPHAASAAFLKGASRAVAVRRDRPATRNTRHRGRTRQPAAVEPRPTHLSDDTITFDDAEDVPGTGDKPPFP